MKGKDIFEDYEALLTINHQQEQQIKNHRMFLGQVLVCLNEANEQGKINDTIWFDEFGTLFDEINNRLQFNI